MKTEQQVELVSNNPADAMLPAALKETETFTAEAAKYQLACVQNTAKALLELTKSNWESAGMHLDIAQEMLALIRKLTPVNKLSRP